jgi:hypothetical protein
MINITMCCIHISENEYGRSRLSWSGSRKFSYYGISRFCVSLCTPFGFGDSYYLFFFTLLCCFWHRYSLFKELHAINFCFKCVNNITISFSSKRATQLWWGRIEFHFFSFS